MPHVAQLHYRDTTQMLQQIATMSNEKYDEWFEKDREENARHQKKEEKQPQGIITPIMMTTT